MTTVTISDTDLARAQQIAGWMKDTLATIEAEHPGDVAVRRLHRQANAGALHLASMLQMPAETFGGVGGGTVHPDSGGTDKPPAQK